MKSKEYAEKYAGLNVSSAVDSGEKTTGRLVGYCACRDGCSFVIIEEKDSPVRPNDSMRIEYVVYDPPLRKNSGIISLNDLTIEEVIVKTIAKPYPNTCKKCYSPARDMNGYVLCSNLKCKTHKKTRTLLKSPPILQEKYVRCKCGNDKLSYRERTDKNAVFECLSCFERFNYTLEHNIIFINADPYTKEREWMYDADLNTFGERKQQ